MSAILDTLWNAGSRHACTLAVKLFAHMCESGTFR